MASRTESRVGILAIAVVALLALGATPASAGRFIATGHDVDDHCGTPLGDPDNEQGQCHYMEVATEYVRAGAPQPALPVLLLDCSGQTENALDNAFASVVPRQRVCPSDDATAFDALALSTSAHSAIIVGSSCDDDNSLNLTDSDPGGCDELGGSTPDSDLINARAADIAAYFNAGGGLFVMSGGDNGDGDASSGPDVFYDFVPIGIQGVEVTEPFCLTQVGIDIGFEDQGCPDPTLHNGTNDDINCCPTHNSFSEPPADSALEVAERDDEGFAETLVAEGVIEDGEFVPPPPPPQEPPPAEPPPPEPPAEVPALPADVGPCGTIDEPVTIAGTIGDDLIEGTLARDVISGGPGDDRINGLDGNDVACGHGGKDRLIGAEGRDTLRGGKKADVVKGGDGNDTVRGQTGRDKLDGGEGNETLTGNKGADKLRGKDGDDKLKAGPGHDRLNGGPDRDRFKGGDGNDRANAVDGERDKVNCGAGSKDRARVDAEDEVSKSCERVVVVGSSSS